MLIENRDRRPSIHPRRSRWRTDWPFNVIIIEGERTPMEPIVITPGPSYYAVTFTSFLKGHDVEGYYKTAERMLELASQQPGFLGYETARGEDGPGASRFRIGRAGRQSRTGKRTLSTERFKGVASRTGIKSSPRGSAGWSLRQASRRIPKSQRLLG